MRILFFILLAAFIGGGIFYAKLQGYIHSDLLDRVDFSQLQQLEIATTAQEQTQTFLQRGNEVVSHTQNVLGTQITAEEEKTPISQRAFEYGRYLYCQQVIKDYEQRMP